jgi:hypothetical protein
MAMPNPYNEYEAERAQVLEQETRHEQRWFFWLAMVYYLVAVLVSVTNPTLPLRTGNVVELWLNTVINIVLVLIGLLAYWYSRQPDRIRNRLQQLAYVRSATRTQSFLTLGGALVLLVSSGGSPTFILIASLAGFFGGLQYRWVSVAERFGALASAHQADQMPRTK